jgi:hypothetical protein
MNHRRKIGTQRIADRQHGRQQLIFHANKGERFLCRRHVVRRNRCHRLTGKHRVLARQKRMRAARRVIFRRVGNICRGDHSVHSRQQLGFGRVNRYDPRVRVRAAQKFRGQRMRQLHIRAKNRLSARFFLGIHARDALPYDLMVSHDDSSSRKLL